MTIAASPIAATAIAAPADSPSAPPPAVPNGQLRLSLVAPHGAASAPLSLVTTASGQAEAPLHLVLLPEDAFSPQSGAWVVYVTIDGVDVTARLAGVVEVEAAEGAARIATLSYAPAPGVINLPALTGLAVAISAAYESMPAVRVFTGVVDAPEYDPDTGIVTLTCTDNLQSRINAMSNDEIAAILPGSRWSHVVYDETRTGWDHAQDRLDTLCASLDADPTGALRVTPWAVGIPQRVYTVGDYLDGSLEVDLADLASLVPSVKVAFSYRFPRLKVRAAQLSWRYSFNWRTAALGSYSYLPADVALSAIESAGWEVHDVTFERFPAHVVFQGALNGQPLNMYYAPELCCAFRGLVSRRYSQWVDERYEITVTSPFEYAARNPAGGTEQATLTVDYDTAEWERGELSLAAARRAAGLDYLAGAVVYVPMVPAPPSPGETKLDIAGGEKDDRAAAEAAVATLIARAQRTIQSSLRASTVSWTVPFDPTIDLTQTLGVATQRVTASGKVRSVRHVFDADAGSASTTVGIAVCPVGGVPPDAPGMPPRPQSSVPLTAADISTAAYCYVGSTAESPELNDAMVGFFTNAARDTDQYSADAPVYPEHFTVATPEITSAHRDALVTEPATLTLSAGSPGGSVILEA